MIVEPLTRRLAPRPLKPSTDLAAEAIAIKIRWFGLILGLLLANLDPNSGSSIPLNIILMLGFGFTIVDTATFVSGRVFLRDDPLLISAMEAIFIGLLCTFSTGCDSPFRFYYLLSLICCAMRYSPGITLATFALDFVSYTIVTLVEIGTLSATYFLTLLVLAWVAWAAVTMARLLRRTSDELRHLNDALQENQTLLETRIAERTRELEESQAQVLHQEKMAAFGLLAAGIAHEVGNPLTSISAILQMLELRDIEHYTRDRLQLVHGETERIRIILRELVMFSRPASVERGRFSIAEVIDEALQIARYYQGGKQRQIVAEVEDNLPILYGVRDQFVQIVFNFVLNAIDATGKGGRITVSANVINDQLNIAVSDDGSGISAEHQIRLFKPYFTTKKHGTGLGLFVVRRIVEEYCGTFAVESKRDEGSRFLVTFPMKVLQCSVVPRRSPTV